MLYYTHIVFSILVGLFTSDFFQIKDKLFFFVFLILFTLLPDIETPNSKIGKKVPVLSHILKFIFGHRQFFHSLLFIVIFYILLSFISSLVAVAFLIAVSSHLILDALTKEGIIPFYPLKFRVRGFLKTGKFAEILIFSIILILVILKLSTGHT